MINETAIRCLNGNIGHIVKLDNRHPKKSNSTFFRIDGCNSCDFKDYCKRWMNKKEENFKIIEVDFRPTAENFSKYFYDEFVKKGYKVKSATVYETPNNCATYSEV